MTVEQLAGAAGREDRPETIASLVVPLSPVRIDPGVRLDATLARFAAAEHDVLLVVVDGDSGTPRLEGVLTRRDVLRVYEHALRGTR